MKKIIVILIVLGLVGLAIWGLRSCGGNGFGGGNGNGTGNGNGSGTSMETGDGKGDKADKMTEEISKSIKEEIASVEPAMTATPIPTEPAITVIPTPVEYTFSVIVEKNQIIMDGETVSSAKVLVSKIEKQIKNGNQVRVVVDKEDAYQNTWEDVKNMLEENEIPWEIVK